jgi:hypothetical protein
MISHGVLVFDELPVSVFVPITMEKVKSECFCGSASFLAEVVNEATRRILFCRAPLNSDATFALLLRQTNYLAPWLSCLVGSARWFWINIPPRHHDIPHDPLWSLSKETSSGLMNYICLFPSRCP